MTQTVSTPVAAEAPEPPPVRDVVVVGVDGSPSSRQALHWAEFLAHAAGCTVEAVSVWPPFSSYGQIGAGWAMMPIGWDPAADARTMCTTALEDAFGAERPAGLQVRVEEGSPTQVLIDASRGARMLVTGSRGHGGFAGLLLGSVSAACAEHATCPVFIVHGDTPPPTEPALVTGHDGAIVDPVIAPTSLRTDVVIGAPGLPHHMAVADGARVVTSADVTTPSDALGTVLASFTAEAGHLPVGSRTRLVDAVLDLPAVQTHVRIAATVPVGDAETLLRLAERCDGMTTHAAGSTVLVHALLPAPTGPVS